jgi:uncharacterized OsmC-like protein/alpha-beta hydrolase superfamily lysophospholipase
MNKQPVEFSNEQGETLRGDVYRPLRKPRAFVLFAHCFTCASNWKATVKIARALCEEGFAVLAFDFTGLGRSGGEFADTNFTTNVADLGAAARYIEATHGEGPAMLVGHSLGGTAVLAVAGDIASCRAVVTIAAPSRAAHVENLLSDARQSIESAGEARVDIGGRPFLIRKQFLDDLNRHAVPDNLRALGRALLILHSPVDTVVSISNAGEIFERAVHPKSFVSLDDADHLLNREEDAEYAAAVLSSWASRYLGVREKRAKFSAAGESVIAQTGREGFLTEIDAAGHELVADEPLRVGGNDAGPSPYALLAAALASCTSMTLQLYARRKGLALETATVRVRHSRVHAEDCADCEKGAPKIDKFDRDLVLVGELDEAARQRLFEIANRCPVHRTLEGQVIIETALADE